MSQLAKHRNDPETFYGDALERWESEGGACLAPENWAADTPPLRRVWTIGHSTSELSEFVRLLRRHGVDKVVDVRRFPGSRHNPQFGADMAVALQSYGIDYEWLEDLGGRRRLPDTHQNDAWHNHSFRAYADYALSDQFGDALARLEQIAGSRPCAIMCAEAVPWRCHRWLIADALTTRGWQVRHIIGTEPTRRHELSGFAHFDGVHLTYPQERVFEGTASGSHAR